jgi:RNA polymerase sigma-70 factor, ECF subfamily
MTTPSAQIAMRREPPATPPGQSEPDAEAGLVHRARNGSREAAERLATESYSQLFASCCRMTGDPDRAADLVQETYRKAWQSLASFRGDSRFSTWLFRIAFTTHLKQLRRPRLVLPIEPEREAAIPDPGPSPEADAARRERGEQLRRAVATLPDELRFPISAHYWADTPVREIAAVVGITPVAIRKRMAKAFRLIAAQLQPAPETTR